MCIHHTTCKNKTCPYYGKYPLWTAATKIDDILNGVHDSDSNCNCGKNPCICDLNNDNKISDAYKLVINGYEIDEPKFH